MHIYKSHGIIKNYKEKLLYYSIGPFTISICLEERNVFARFDEIPSIKNYKGK